jgi:outer membrane biosynthesis protein TonB
LDINVNVHFDENFVNALSDIAGCLAAVSVANSGNLNAHLPEKTVEPPKAPAKPAQKAEPKKDTKTEEKPLTGEPVTRQKAKEINDLVDAPEPKKEEPKKEEAPKADDKEKELREQIKKGFIKAARAGKNAECIALLTEIGVKKQSQIPADKLEEVLTKVEAL